MKANGSDDMKQETMLAEILKALKLHREQVEKQFVNMDLKFEKRFADMEEKYEKRFSEAKFEKRFDDMDQWFDLLEKKVDGIRVDLTDTQEVTNFSLSRTAKIKENAAPW